MPFAWNAGDECGNAQSWDSGNAFEPTTECVPGKAKEKRTWMFDRGVNSCFFMICGIVGATASRANKETAGSTNAEVVEDVQQFSGISVEALKEIMGDPVAEEEWTNSTSKGEFPVTTLQYEKNSNHYEFIIAEDAVVRLSIYSNQYWNGTGDLFSYSGDKENILKMFNVDAGESARIETDNGVSYVLVSVMMRLLNLMFKISMRTQRILAL